MLLWTVRSVRSQRPSVATYNGPPALVPVPTDDRFQPPNGCRPMTAPVMPRLTYRLPACTVASQSATSSTSSEWMPAVRP